MPAIHYSQLNRSHHHDYRRQPYQPHHLLQSLPARRSARHLAANASGAMREVTTALAILLLAFATFWLLAALPYVLA